MVTPVDRFWSRVVKHDGCWEWTGAKWPFGYGSFRAYTGPKFSMPRNGYVDAHRFSWELHNGPIPEGMFVCHRCDHPPCTNPEHLFLGTQKDNMQDCSRKGKAGRAPILTAEEVDSIKGWMKRGLSRPKVAKIFAVSPALIDQIAWGQLKAYR